ncbi:MAG: hypothetical protein ACJ74Y_01760 [Bryobacteraceae bacterium]
MKSTIHTLPFKSFSVKGRPKASVIRNGGTISYFGSLLARSTQLVTTRLSNEAEQTDWNARLVTGVLDAAASGS